METKCSFCHPECIFLKCFRLSKVHVCEGNPVAVPTNCALICVMGLPHTGGTGFLLGEHKLEAAVQERT